MKKELRKNIRFIGEITLMSVILTIINGLTYGYSITKTLKTPQIIIVNSIIASIVITYNTYLFEKDEKTITKRNQNER